MQHARSIVAALLALAVAALPACSSAPDAVKSGGQAAPTGAGNYMLTVRDAATERPVEGVTVRASGAGARQRGTKPAAAVTDEDGVAVLRFGDWGAIELRIEQGAVNERWMITQNRVAVNGGKSTREPLRLMVGSRSNGGASAYGLAITRIERGGKVDN